MLFEVESHLVKSCRSPVPHGNAILYGIQNGGEETFGSKLARWYVQMFEHLETGTHLFEPGKWGFHYIEGLILLHIYHYIYHDLT